MVFQLSKPIILTILVLLVILTGCTQTPNYAPVKTVNQAIEPNNGYYFRKKIPVKPLNNPDDPQESTKDRLDVQQNNPVRQNSAINSSSYSNPYQNHPTQNHSVAPAIKQKMPRLLSPENTNNIDKIQIIRNNRPLAAQVEPYMKNKLASPDIGKNRPPKQQKTQIATQQTSDYLANKQLIPSIHNRDALPKKPTHNVQVTDKNLLISKNVKEKTPIISIDNKKMLKLNFQWPIYGKIFRNFAQTDSKGIDITGKTGQAVQAAESGKAVYCGQGLAGYGNLVIIKHNANYLSAYANNSKLYIKEGQQIDKGQTIGQIGLTRLKKALLHFEIRKNGKPINPLTLMPKH